MCGVTVGNNEKPAPSSNRLLSVLAGGVTRSFTYSASGNVTLDDVGGSGTVLTYNSLDRLVQVSAGAVTLVDYVYAATGQRAIKTTPTATTHYLYDPGGALYAETDGAGNVLREYITLGGATLAIVDALGVGYVHDDHLGTPQVMTDGSAAVVWDASYRPFGEAVIAGAAANEQRFPGQTADAETGYYDNWHRTYDPSLGRYLQSDPIGIMAGFNTYGYVGGNPVMFTDPKGLNPRAIGGAGLVIAVAGVVASVACTMPDILPDIPTGWVPSSWIPSSWIPKWPWPMPWDPAKTNPDGSPGPGHNQPDDDYPPSPWPQAPWGPGNGNDDGGKPFALGRDVGGSLEKFAREHNAKYYKDYPGFWKDVVTDKLMDPDTEILVNLDYIGDPYGGAMRGLGANPSPMDWELGQIYSGQYQGTIRWYENGAPAADPFK